MGLNSTLIIRNDALNEIKNDYDFGKKVADAVQCLSSKSGDAIEISSGNHCNSAMVLETHHADVTNIIAVGGNHGTVLFRLWGKHHKEEDKLRLVKEMADELGYRMVKKND